MFEAGELMAKEANHKGAHVILGPTVNIQRGPLGGRGFESYSPDPVLSGMSAASVISGMQSKGIAATIKHFVCNDLEDQRNSTNALVGQRALREVYLMPFQLAIRDSDPKALMTSYNKVNGEHASQSDYLINQIVRGEWGWNGTTMSDWFGCYSLGEALKGGLDIEMPGPPILRKHDAIAHSIASKEINIQVLDDRVRNVLKLVKYAKSNPLGFVENGPEDTKNNIPETSALLRKIAAETIVLLKNENDILPLKKTDNIAVIGPNAKVARVSGGGSASMLSYYVTDPYTGIAAKLGKEPLYAVGTTINHALPDLGPLCKTKDGEKGFWNKTFLDPPELENREFAEEFSLETTVLTLFDYKNERLTKKNLFYLDLEGFFTPEEDGDYEFGVSCLGTLQLFIDGELFIDNKTEQIAGSGTLGASTIEMKRTIKMSKDKTYKIDIEFGSSPTFKIETNDLVSTNGGGALNVGVQKILDKHEEIKKAAQIASQVDKVVLCIGTSSEHESEGFDRKTMDLPGLQYELVDAIVAANPNTIVVNQSGTPVTLPFINKVPLFVNAWFTGLELGNAIADVLFGDVNPSGKLSITFPIRNEDNPAFLNFKTNNGETVYGEDVYVDYRYYEKVKRDVLFPFGFGLSYTNFSFGNLKVAVEGDDLTVSVDVTNTGDKDGAEVAQLYIAPKSPSITRPVKELKNFGKKFIKAGSTETISLTTPLKYATSFFDEYLDQWKSELGDYEVLVGNSSASIALSEGFKVEEDLFWSGL